MTARSLTRRSALALIGGGTVAALAACAQQPKPKAAKAPKISGDAVVTARGTFEGKSNHVTTGHASIVRSEGKWLIKLEDDFVFDGAPDPKVALGNGGFDPKTLHGPLRSNTGKQVYELNKGLDIGDYTQVWIWCEKFSVPLGVADLKLV